MPTPGTTSLPVDTVIPDLRTALCDGNCAVLQAPPGAGKTTAVPLALLDEDWAQAGTIIVLEPRRLAARAAAYRMAETLGEKVGDTVGYRVRLDSKVGPRTRIEIITEGILTRRLLRDPELAGVAAVLFDEFHERSIHADLGLALCRDVQSALRLDLRLLVMSATLDTAAMSALLDGAPVIASEGRAYPVDTRYHDDLDNTPEGVAEAVTRALADEAGSILVFLPGEREIRQAEELITKACPADVVVAPLYGALDRREQDAAILPAEPGTRKVVLATNIAETSLTIEGIRVVIDSGLARAPRFDPVSGMSRLQTVKVSRASLTQRAGRAGRTEPGVCYRLWPQAAEGALPTFDSPEILDSDLAPLALALAEWGVTDPHTLAWLDPPPAQALAESRRLLTELGALDADSRITAHGRAMADLPLHPRLAHMVIKGQEAGHGTTACRLAAILDEGDILSAPARNDPDMRRRMDILNETSRSDHGANRAAVKRAANLARVWQKRIGASGKASDDREQTGRLLALAYPDRVALARPGQPGRFLLRNGRGAFLPDDEPLAAEPCLAIADLDGRQREARIRRAAPLDRADLTDLFSDQIAEEETIQWDTQSQSVRAERRQRLGALVLKRSPLDLATNDPRIVTTLCLGIRKSGPDCLPWTDAARQLQHRLAFAARIDPDTYWPVVSDDALLKTLEDWLAPFLTGITDLAGLSGIDVHAALMALLDWPARGCLDDLAPTHFALPKGRKVKLDYTVDPPVLATKLQDLFGVDTHPAIAGGRVPLSVHLLSPAGRPLQVTTDLPGFWRGSYKDVRKDMRGRYPKHKWPENPLENAD